MVTSSGIRVTWTFDKFMNVDIFEHSPISLSLMILISLILPSAGATIPFPIFLSRSMKKRRKKPVNKSNKNEINKKVLLIFAVRLTDKIKKKQPRIKVVKIKRFKASLF